MDMKMDHETQHSQPSHQSIEHKGNPYRDLAIMILVSYIVMYFAMYAMVNTLSNVFNNINQFYMAGLMAAPMVIIMVAMMGSMYPNKRLNRGILIGSAIITLIFFILIRQQAVIGNKQFLRSMIPHHAGAILMCQQASVTDPEIQDLCKEIISGQQGEIDQMKGILERLNQR